MAFKQQTLFPNDTTHSLPPSSSIEDKCNHYFHNFLDHYDITGDYKEDSQIARIVLEIKKSFKDTSVTDLSSHSLEIKFV